MLNSHCHEDHVAGNHLFPDVPWHLHEADLPGIRSLDGFMAIFGYEGDVGAQWVKALVEQFHFMPRPDAVPFRGGDVFELGGGVRVEAIHTPGHTRGHCAFRIEPAGILYLGDIDLSSFGPYYGDAWSDLEDFERSLARVREIDARWYATFHHIGVLEGRAAFLERLDRFCRRDRPARGAPPRLPGRAPQPRRGGGAPLRLPPRGSGALRRARGAPQHGPASGASRCARGACARSSRTASPRPDARGGTC